VLLDPPRSGAFEVCKKLASSKVERVVYVSCNPETLARDAEILVAGGYQFDGAGVIDMFPHTTHVESIACFSK
jgi:23S rRNA (uracil1939-C5)-methyltransferase